MVGGPRLSTELRLKADAARIGAADRAIFEVLELAKVAAGQGCHHMHVYDHDEHHLAVAEWFRREGFQVSVHGPGWLARALGSTRKTWLKVSW